MFLFFAFFFLDNDLLLTNSISKESVVLSDELFYDGLLKIKICYYYCSIYGIYNVVIIYVILNILFYFLFIFKLNSLLIINYNHIFLFILFE